jgi:hypothetical protein
MSRRILYIILFLLIATPVWATTYYYVDPTFTGGSNDGSATNPWLRLDQDAQWNVINATLASDAVTIYFSARIVASDTAETTTTPVFVHRTDTSTNLLTLDGNHKYNTNDSSGSWVDYTGTNRFTISVSSNVPMYFHTGDYAHRDYVTVRGFKLVGYRNGQTMPNICGNNLTLTDLEVTQTSSGSATGGGIGIGYAYIRTPLNTLNCGSLSNITISNNIIHDVEGEGIYIGGCDDQTDCTTGHSNITITGNIIYDGDSSIGGQPDGIDIKDANTNVTVADNIIYLTTKPNVQADGIVNESNAIIERNFINNMPRGGIVLPQYYNNARTAKVNGATIRNNIIVNCGGFDATSSNGIMIYITDGGNDWNNVKIYNNTIWREDVKGRGIRGGMEKWEIINVDVANNLVRGTSDLKGVITLRNNLLGELEGYFVDAASGDLRLTNLASNAINKGIPLTDITDDFLGCPRDATPDIGAYEFGECNTSFSSK